MALHGHTPEQKKKIKAAAGKKLTPEQKAKMKKLRMRAKKTLAKK